MRQKKHMKTGWIKIDGLHEWPFITSKNIPNGNIISLQTFTNLLLFSWLEMCVSFFFPPPKKKVQSTALLVEPMGVQVLYPLVN